MEIEKVKQALKETRGRPPEYRFEEMDVGDSVFIEGEDSQGKASRAAHQRKYFSGKRFSARSVEGGVRIWRVE